jgi:FlaA1/EpsC-like NDP-sugar epimerase
LSQQLAQLPLKKLILLDQAETSLSDLQFALNHSACHLRFVLGSVTDKLLLESIFITEKIDIIFHAAAYKHVPMMEQHPRAAALVNVGGTKLLADLAQYYEVNQFVFVSTDKAVSPVSVMGASKKLAEHYLQQIQPKGRTIFSVVRFGNVIATSGSVFLRFRQQILQRKPITITHPEVTRYFMHIETACALLLTVATLQKDGTYIFDMGKKYKILQLAEDLIKLHGLLPHFDIPITFTGLRQGDKLHETLWEKHEKVKPTLYRKILRADFELRLDTNFTAHIDDLLQIAKDYSVSNEQLKSVILATLPRFEDIADETRTITN